MEGKERHKYGFISMYEEIRHFYNLFFDTFCERFTSLFMLLSSTLYSIIQHYIGTLIILACNMPESCLIVDHLQASRTRVHLLIKGR